MAKRFDTVVDVKPSAVRAPKARASKSAKTSEKDGKDTNYTVAGILALCAIVLITAIYFNNWRGYSTAELASGHAFDSGNLGGGAIATGDVDPDAPAACESSSWCDGSKLVRQHTDCRVFTVYCQYGCTERSDGAICR